MLTALPTGGRPAKRERRAAVSGGGRERGRRGVREKKEPYLVWEPSPLDFEIAASHATQLGSEFWLGFDHFDDIRCWEGREVTVSGRVGESVEWRRRRSAVWLGSHTCLWSCRELEVGRNAGGERPVVRRKEGNVYLSRCRSRALRVVVIESEGWGCESNVTHHIRRRRPS